MSQRPTLKAVLKALGSNRKDWYLIGVYLDIDDRVLDTIRANEQDVRMQCTMMVQKWLRSNPSASWGDLYEALKELGEHTLAEQIFTQHCDSTGGSSVGAQLPAPESSSSQGGQPQNRSPQPTTRHEPRQPDTTNRIVQATHHQPGQPTPPTMPTVPDANLDQLSETDKWDLSVKFSTLFLDFVPLLDDAVEAPALKLFLKALHYPATGEPYINPELYCDCKSTGDVLRSFCPRFINVMHPFLLRDIVKRFGCGKSKKLMEEYDATFPRSVPLDQLVDPLPDSVVAVCRGSTTLTLLVEGHVTTFTPDDLERFQTVFTTALGIKPVALVFSKHGPGNSVRLTFLIPDCILGAVIDLSKDRRKLIELSCSGILAIESDACTIDLTEDPRYWKHAMMRRSYGEHHKEWDVLSRDSGLSSMSSSRSTSFSDVSVLGDASTKDDERAFAFAEKLRSNTTDREAEFEQANISDVAAAQLADGLSDNHSLKALRLWRCRISSEGMTHLSSALQTNKSLTSLKFWHTELSDEAVDELAKSLNINETLQTLDLFNCKVSDRGAASLADSLYNNRSLKSLDLEGNNIACDGARSLSEALRVNETLEELDLSGNDISDNGALALATSLLTNHSIKTLHLRSNNVSDRGATSLSEALSVNKTLTTLDLSYNDISDGGTLALATSLHTNHSIKALHLFGNKLTDTAVSGVAEAVQVSHTLETLWLSLHMATDRGAGMLADSLEATSSLKELWLDGTSHISKAVKDRMRGIARRKGIVLHFW